MYVKKKFRKNSNLRATSNRSRMNPDTAIGVNPGPNIDSRGISSDNNVTAYQRDECSVSIDPEIIVLDPPPPYDGVMEKGRSCTPPPCYGDIV